MLSSKLKEVREARGMSQVELSEASGISRATISAMENGVARNTTSKTLVALATALATTVDDLFFS